MTATKMNSVVAASNCVKFYLHYIFYCLLLSQVIRYADSEYTLQADNQCTSPSGLSFTNIKSGIWSFKPQNPTSQCLGVFTKAATGVSCTISISFCAPLPDGWCGNLTTTQPSVCFKTFNGTGKKENKTYHGGEYVANPFTSTVLSSAGGFKAVFGASEYALENGTKINLTSQAIFVCNRKSIWQISLDPNNTIPAIAKPLVTVDLANKLLTMTFEYDGACLAIQPAVERTILSAGTVLIIIFFISLSVYCIFGSAFNYCRGYKGKEMIPQSEFWTDLPVLVADGVLFTCRCCKSDSQSAYDSI